MGEREGMLLDNGRKGPLLCNGRSLATSLPTLTWKVPNVTRELVDSVARFSERVLKTTHGFPVYRKKETANWLLGFLKDT